MGRDGKPGFRLSFSWVLPAGAVVLAYAAALAILPGDGFWINDNGLKLIQMEGLRRSGYTEFSIPWPGAEVDPFYRYNPLPPPFGLVVNGRLYGLFPLVLPLITSFPHRLLGSTGLYILPLLGGLLTLPAVWSLAGLLPNRRTAQPLALWLVALCTPMWFYSMTFWEHALAACLATWSVVFFTRYLIEGRVRPLVLGAVFCGAAVYFREALYVWGAVLAAVSARYGPRGWRGTLLFLLALALSLSPLWLFQWATVGNPLGFHVTSISPLEGGVGTYLIERWTVVRNLLLDSHNNLWLSLAASAPFFLLFVFRPGISGRALDKAVLSLAAIGLAAGLIVMSGHLRAGSPIWHLLESNGFFAASPVLILAFIGRAPPGARPRREGKDAERILWLISLLYVSAYVALSPALHTIGIYWGGRYLLALYPLFGVLAASTIARWGEGRRPATGILVGLLIALSLAMQVYSLYLLYERKSFSARLNRAVARRPEKVIVALGWFIPQELAPSFYERKIFLARDPRDLEGLLGSLRRAGVRDALLVAWRRDSEVLPGEKEVLDDGLNFTTIELKPISLQRWKRKKRDSPLLKRGQSPFF